MLHHKEAAASVCQIAKISIVSKVIDQFMYAAAPSFFASAEINIWQVVS